MAGSCKRDGCHADLPCLMGEAERSECEHWQPEEGAPAGQVPLKPAADSVGVAWNGVAAGVTDLAYLAARGRPRIVGLLGPYDAGKTTFLAIFYSLLLRGGRVGEDLCAGSYTLAGWEGIARYMRWTRGRQATFPPHTSSYATRQPGLLHLALRVGHRLDDVFFTDAPGEWFTEWARAEGSGAAEGARWIAQRADLLMIFVDTARLADSQTRGEARSQYQLLVERCASVARDRPVVMIRTKSDVSLPEAVTSFLHQRQVAYLPVATWHDVTKDRPDDLFNAMASAIDLAVRPAPKREAHHELFPVTTPADAFLAFRGSP
ncbi:MAG: TRAFAC clade GTPase domain-containing protein [Polyangiaceae bacterium]